MKLSVRCLTLKSCLVFVVATLFLSSSFANETEKSFFNKVKSFFSFSNDKNDESKESAQSEDKQYNNKRDLKNLNPRVFELAAKAHRKAVSLGLAKKSLLTIIDYSLPSTQRRLWVVDMSKQKVIYHEHVAHGSGSGMNKAERFSDKPGSLQTSLGLFVTGNTYQGKHGLSLVLHGLEKGINGNAERRAIVMHGANYVNFSIVKQQGRLGRSWGCPAVRNEVARPMIQTIKEGSLIFAYYPDNKWLKQSRFL